jgi:hypothetical protein
MKKKVLITCLLIITIIVITTVLLITNTLSYKIEHGIKNFKSKEITNMKKDFYEPLDEEDTQIDYYYYIEKPVNDNGSYFKAKILYPKQTITIEENVIQNGVNKDPDYFYVSSILYSKEKLTKDYADDFLNIVHINSCGAKLEEFNKVKDNYYYVKYYMAEDC